MFFKDSLHCKDSNTIRKLFNYLHRNVNSVTPYVCVVLVT